MKFLYLSVFVIFLISCGKNSSDELYIVTETNQLPDNKNTGEVWLNNSQARLVLINISKKDKHGKVLTENFYSACSPDISYDGKSVIFAGRKTQNEPWQIWEMKIKSMNIRQITNSKENSVSPAYLPDGRIVFSRLIENDSLKAGYSLFTCNADGTEVRRITFNPHTYQNSSVLRDGRILTVSKQIFPDNSESVYTVLRPDGTKAELFYKPERNNLVGKGLETRDGKIVFIEKDSASDFTGKLISVNYNRPLNSRDVLSSNKGSFCSVFLHENGKVLVSYRTSESEKFALCEYNIQKKEIEPMIYKSTDNHIVEMVRVGAHERPRKLPSEVDFGVKTGLLLCQNINLTGITSPESGFAEARADRVEILGVNSSLGTVKVEKDGSVYLKVAADMPFRIQTLDSLGNIVNGPGGWYYLRPNERRGCVGCHEDNEIAPANRYAQAVAKNPVIIPVHIEGVKEKNVELE